MADEVQYASGPDNNKRKYDDTADLTSPSPDGGGRRRPTGFSSPHSAAAALPSSGIESAKLRAQEIASRLFNDAEAKRPKFDNGGFDSPSPIHAAPKPLATNVHVTNTTSSLQDSYSYQGTTRKIDIPNGRVGVIIGKGGETIKYLQLQSGAKIQVTRDMDSDPNSSTRTVELVGTPDQITKAEQLIHEVLAEAEAGGSVVVSRRYTGQAGTDQFSMKVPNNKVGLVIGKGGETIKNIQARSGARVQVIPLHPPPGDTSTERTVQIDGSDEQIETAKQLVNEVISEVYRDSESTPMVCCDICQRWVHYNCDNIRQQQLLEKKRIWIMKNPLKGRRSFAYISLPSKIIGFVKKDFELKRGVVEVNLNSSPFVASFLHMVHLNFKSGLEHPMAWIDEGGKCLFPQVFCSWINF